MPRSRHPRGLYVLFLSEMWERFSFYGMRALLILYLVNHLKWRQAEASNVYKWYTSLVYLTPILGGFLADRYLGNKRAVVIGALLMSAGHFLMAVEAMEAFYAALVLLIVGNGFFKPNISTQVGRLYPRGDPRRDSAYTIFYMGINLGAFLSPLVCGVLARTQWGYHAGFAAAGVGMLIGLVTYLVGLRWVVELPPGEPAAAPDAAMSEAEASRAPPALPRLERMSPRLVAGFGLAVIGFTAAVAIAKVVGLQALGSLVSGDNLLTLGLLGACALLGARILSQVEEAARERVLAIYAMGVFAVFFWAAFEQTGNTFNLWADKETNRYLTVEAPPPSPLPEAILDADGTTTVWEYIQGLLSINPFPTIWFQSANSLAIVIFGPVFTALWLALARRNREPSTPAKMAMGVVFMGLASAVMALAARSEDRPSSTALAALPPAIALDAEGRVSEKTGDGPLAPFHAGRLKYDPSRQVLEMMGVLPDTERDRILRETAPAAYRAAVKDLAQRSEGWRNGQPEITLALAEIPPGFDLRYAGFPEKKVRFDPSQRTLTVAMVIEDKDQKALLVAASDPVLRGALNDLYVRSDAFRVSPWYLIWCYLFMTFGELCLSPVGLSMVSKLAPARFATMLMGLWFLTNSLGNFVAGALGESWGTVAPIPYFLLIVLVLGGAAAVAFIIGRKISALMHGVR